MLDQYIQKLSLNCDSIPENRKELLSKLVTYLKTKQVAGETAKLNFICTHNSRRSHIGQIWATTLSAFFNIPNIETYSGGTEATAFNPRAVAAFRRIGFDIAGSEGDNPVYQVKFDAAAKPIQCWSKKYDDDANPNKGFAAIMTCDHADVNCPIVFGTDFRLALTYEDPKVADDTPLESERYDERVRQIGLEICWLMKKLSE